MNLGTGLWQQQTIKLAMTQELSQAIALLQYSALELTAFLEEKALDNPLVELDHSNVTTDTYDQPIRAKNNTSAGDGQTDWIEQMSDKSVMSLRDYLLSQLNFKSIDAEVERTFTRLIDHIDENGYLRVETDEIARELSVSTEVVNEAIALLHGLEPAGIGARHLQQCLLIQIQRADDENELAERMIDGYFIAFAEKQWRELAKTLQVSLKDIQAVFDYVRTLNPRPGADFATEDCSYIVPDVIVTLHDDDFTVKIVNDHIPAVSFNRAYHDQLASYKNREVAEFLQEKSRDFQWIVKSIQQRNETLTKVMLEIISKQQPFFRDRKNQLTPLTMKDVAAAIDVHESTVSRTVREKYVQTPFGTFPLRSFFTSALQTVTDGDTSSAQVKHEISTIVAAENKNKPLSDQKIATELKETVGIVVSRRTIAKYREQLSIPSSTKRKRFD